MTFAEIEKIIGSKLPPSAYDHRPWWSNNPSNNVMTKVWLEAGFQTEQVDLPGQKLVFRYWDLSGLKRAVDEMPLAEVSPGAMAEEGREFKQTESKQPGHHPLIGAMKGTFTIEPGFDLTSPMLDPEELAEWEANLDRTADLIEQGMSSKRR
jgi:hypothetical protein